MFKSNVASICLNIDGADNLEKKCNGIVCQNNIFITYNFLFLFNVSSDRICYATARSSLISVQKKKGMAQTHGTMKKQGGKTTHSAPAVEWAKDGDRLR